MRTSDPTDSDIQKGTGWRTLSGGNGKIGFFLFFLVFLTLTLLFQLREARMETYEIGSKSNKYVIAHTDFQYLDEDARAPIQKQVRSDILHIYRIDANQISDIADDILTGNRKLNGRGWKDQPSLQKVTSRQLSLILGIVKENLKKTEFADRRTITVLKNHSIDTDWYLPLESTDSIKSISIPRNKETALYWNELFGEDEHQNTPVRDFLTVIIENTTWNLVPQEEKQAHFQDIVAAQVPAQKTTVEAGQAIIRKNDVITMRHLDMISAMKKAMGRTKAFLAPLPLVGNMMLALIFTVLGFTYLRVKHANIFEEDKKLALFITLFITTIVLAKGTEYFLLYDKNHFFALVHYPIYVPFASIFVSILLGLELALYITGFLAVILGISLAVDIDRFLVVNLVGAIVGIIYSRSLNKRRQIFGIAIRILISTALVIVTFNFMENMLWGRSSLQDLTVAAIYLFATATLIVTLLPLFESLFNTMTNMRLAEYMESGTKLLKELAAKAKHTHSHSVTVSILSESVAMAVGANSTFCRIASLYHDVGKLCGPEYFTENQEMCNVHRLLTNEESAQEIINHVEYGAQKCRQEGLPKRIIDMVYQHHGTTRVEYFYRKELERQNGDKALVDESKFRYPGPRPQTIEAAIIMITDSSEAACRSLDDPSPEEVRSKIEEVVNDKILDRQFDQCPVSMKEIKIMIDTLVDEIVTSRHGRIKYPKKQSDT